MDGRARQFNEYLAYQSIACSECGTWVNDWFYVLHPTTPPVSLCPLHGGPPLPFRPLDRKGNPLPLWLLMARNAKQMRKKR